MAISLSVAPDLASILRAGVSTFEIAHVTEHDQRLDAPIAEAEAALRTGADRDVSAARALYRAVGLDPTKTRPSSEALLRRVRRGEPLPRVNTLVDVCNWCSVESQLPYGLYDLDRVAPPVVLRRGLPGESYAGIRKDVVHLEGRLTLADAHGPFGNPTSDSARTMVTPSARRVLVVVFAPAAVTPAALTSVLDLTAARMSRWADGRETARWVS